MTNPKRRRSKSELVRDRRIIANLYLKGHTQAEIAERIGIHQTTVSRDIRALHKQWIKSSLRDFDEARAEELARIDHLEREAWMAYLRSQEDAETMTRKEKRPGGEGNRAPQQELTSVTRGQVGDPSFLRIVDKCIERRCKLLGLDAPQRQELSGPGGSPLLTNSAPDTIRIIVHGEEDDQGE